MWGANNGSITPIWNTVDIDVWLEYKRTHPPDRETIFETYYKNPENE